MFGLVFGAGRSELVQLGHVFGERLFCFLGCSAERLFMFGERCSEPVLLLSYIIFLNAF